MNESELKAIIEAIKGVMGGEKEREKQADDPGPFCVKKRDPACPTCGWGKTWIVEMEPKVAGHVRKVFAEESEAKRWCSDMNTAWGLGKKAAG
jgi:hypothetical protein